MIPKKLPGVECPFANTSVAKIVFNPRIIIITSTTMITIFLASLPMTTSTSMSTTMTTTHDNYYMHSHSLQGMEQIQWDDFHDFSSTTCYVFQLPIGTISTQNTF